MSYEDFVQQTTALADSASFHFSTVFFNMFCALGIVGICFVIAISLILANYPTGVIMKSRFLDWFDDTEEDFFIRGVTIFVSLAMFVGGWIYTYNNAPNHDKEIQKLYISYMQSQQDVRFSVAEYVLDDSKIKNTSSDDYERYDSYIFPNAVCENCQQQTILYKASNDDKTYKKVDVLVSYSLDDGQQPYILTKPPLRETIYSYSQGGYYNPILFVPKSKGGIAK